MDKHLSLIHIFTPDLNIQGRMRYERGEEHWVHNAYASSVGNLYPMGRMKDKDVYKRQIYIPSLPYELCTECCTTGSHYTQTASIEMARSGNGSRISL